MPEIVIKNLWDAIKATKSASDIGRILNMVDKVVMEGYPVSVVLSLLERYIIGLEGRYICV